MAASWDSTTSGSSTAARLCPREGTWSRPTAPPGWPSCVPGGRAASATG
jgi:hypothetical protein